MDHQQDSHGAEGATKMSSKSSVGGGYEKKQLLLTSGQENCTKSAGQDEQHKTLAVGSPAQNPPASIQKIKISLCKWKMNEEKVLNFIDKPSSGSKDKNGASNPAGKKTRCKQNNTATNNFVPAGKSKSPALIRAEEVQSNLEPTFPSFIKSMVRSNVTFCFWMGLPRHICEAYLPNNDCTVILEDDFKNQFEMKYLSYKRGLSAGWKRFSIAQHLLEGDVLVFQLVERYKFKVYVVRANNQTEVDVALALLNLGAPKLRGAGKLDQYGSSKSPKRKHQEPLTLAPIKKKNKKNCMPELALNMGQTVDQFESDSEEARSEVGEGFKLSKPSPMFEDIESLEEFRILVDGVSVDSEIPEDVRIKYYELCCSQNALLHDNFITGVNSKLIIGAIIEIVNIADAIQACKLTVTHYEFANWVKTLKALEQLGMNVIFLRARLHKLREEVVAFWQG